MTYDVQELIERCIISHKHGKSQPIIDTTQELPPFPWHTLATDIFYWKRMDFLIDVFPKYFLVRKLANSTSAAICAELTTIVTELDLPHIIRSDNGPCYNSKEFQQFLQRYNITHHTSRPHHPRSNGFVERMVGVSKKLMDKAGKEGKPWISGLYEYSHFTIRKHCFAITAHNTVHTQGERPTSTAEHLRGPGDVSDLSRAHQKAKEQAREELH